MRKFLLSIALLFATPVFAAGTISGVTGMLTQGSTITVSGSGFTTKNSSQVCFENFSSGTVGQPLSTGGSCAWVEYGDSTLTNITEYSISNANPYIGSQHARITATTNFTGTGTDDFGNAYKWSSGQKEVYLEYAAYLNMTTNGTGTGGGPQIKYARITTCHDATTCDDPWIGMNRQMSTSPSSHESDQIVVESHAGPGGSSGTDQGWETFYAPSLGGGDAYDAIPNGAWTQFNTYIKLSSTAGAADGMRVQNINGKNDIARSSYPGGTFGDPLNTGVSNRIWNGAPLITWGTGATETFQYANLPFFKRTDMAFTMDIGYVYLNDSPERVVVHNASTLAASTHYQVQKQILRTALGITFEYQVGNLTGGDDKYVTVVNSDNSFSTSFLSGSGGGTDINGSGTGIDTTATTASGSGTLAIAGGGTGLDSIVTTASGTGALAIAGSGTGVDPTVTTASGHGYLIAPVNDIPINFQQMRRRRRYGDVPVTNDHYYNKVVSNEH